MKPITKDGLFIQVEKNSLRRYLSEISSIPLIALEDEAILAKKICNGDRAAKEMLIISNLRFVVSCAKKYQYMGMDLSDLISEGNLGLIKAAGMFDATRGFKFLTYAVWWIRQSITIALGNDTRTVRLPISMVRMTSQVRLTSDQLEHQLQREPTLAEIAQHLGIPANHEALEITFAGSAVKLEPGTYHPGGEKFLELLADGNAEPSDILLEKESHKLELQRLWKFLNAKQIRVLEMFYGLNGEFSIGLDEIANRLEISSGKVIHLKLSAFEKIRKVKAGATVKVKRDSIPN